MHAELDELSHGMLLLMVVIGLLEHQLLTILTRPLAMLLAAVLTPSPMIQMPSPDESRFCLMTRGGNAMVFLKPTENSSGCSTVAGQGVFQTNVHGSHLASSIKALGSLGIRGEAVTQPFAHRQFSGGSQYAIV